MGFEVTIVRDKYKILFDERQNYGVELDNGYCTMGFDTEKDAITFGEEYANR